MKRLMISGLVIAALATGVVARGQDAKAETLNAKVHAVNDHAKKSGMTKVALHTISVETGVPEDQVEGYHKRFSETGPGGIMISCVMADLTKKPPEEFMKKHSSGEGWGTIAKANNVPMDKLIERLDHLDRALVTTPDKRKNR